MVDISGTGLLIQTVLIPNDFIILYILTCTAHSIQDILSPVARL